MTMTMLDDHDQDLQDLLGGIGARLPQEWTAWPGGYPDQVEAALIDAVLSIRARYGKEDTGVRAAVQRYKSSVGDPAPNSLSRLAAFEAEDLAEVLGNHQRTASTPKALAIVLAARNLCRIGVEKAADVDPDTDTNMKAYVAVPGLGSVTWSYFTMLIGARDVKADTWIRRFVDEVLDTGKPISAEQARVMLKAAAGKLGVDPRVLDHAIWLYMRGRKA